MKYVIVQVSKYYVSITPAETGKAFVSSGSDRNAKKPDYEVTFKEPLVVFLPENLKGQAWNFPRDFANVVKMAMRNAKIDIKDVILCAEGDQVISQEYQHTPAKDKFLKIFAQNEAKALISDDISNYSLINCEYGSGYQKPEDNAQLSANVYIMPKSYVEELKSAFREQSLNLWKLIPPTVSLIKMAQTGIYSHDTSVALISIDYCSARLLVMQNGTPVYVHSFPLPLGDIVNTFANDQNCSLEEAFEVIRKYGVGISEKCNSTQAGREMRQMFDNISNEIVRNLRMVLLSCRIELDRIYVSDFAAYIPGVLKHVRTINVAADEINLISDSFTSLTNVPQITKEADEAGYKTACFYTYLYLVNSGAQNENNLGIITGGQKVDLGSVNAGLVNMVALGVVVIAVGIMAFIGMKSYGLEVRKQNDEAKLHSEKYEEIKELLAKQEELQYDIDHVEEDKQALPAPNAYVEFTLDEVFKQLTENVEFVNTYVVDSDENKITTTFEVKSLEDYVSLQNDIIEQGFFNILESMSATAQPAKDIYSVSHTFEIVGKDKPEETTEEDSGYGTDISRGTNYDEMLESAKGE